MLAALQAVADRPEGLSVRRSGVTERASTVIRRGLGEASGVVRGRRSSSGKNVVLDRTVTRMPRPTERCARDEA